MSISTLLYRYTQKDFCPGHRVHWSGAPMHIRHTLSCYVDDPDVIDAIALFSDIELDKVMSRDCGN